MAQITLEILDKEERVLAQCCREDEAVFSYRDVYHPGDQIRLSSDKEGIYMEIRLDDSVEASSIFLKSSPFIFPIPFGEERKPYGKKAFTEERHWGYVRVIPKEEFKNYRNLAHNAFDQKNQESVFPHAITNVTTDNPQFFARNAIDGICVTDNHGSWPHSSWGINGQDDAWLTIEFGKEVVAEEVIIYLRADFPHDNWWKEAEMIFSDGWRQNVHFQKTGAAQKIKIGKRKITWIKFANLQMSDEESSYPALSQIKVMGRWQPLFATSPCLSL